jgi:hypothetical protein
MRQVVYHPWKKNDDGDTLMLEELLELSIVVGAVDCEWNVISR